MNIIRIDATASTNSYLKELTLQQELSEGTVLIASDQTSGRGQTGTFWESEPTKNLTFSMLLYPHFLPVKQHFLLSEIAALSIKNVLDKYTDHIRIKWPNDIYYNDKKIAGILIENELTGEEISQSIIGIGLNVNQESFTNSVPNPVSLKQILEADMDLDFLLDEIVNELLTQYQNLQEGNIELINNKYHSSLFRNVGYHPYSDENGEFIARIESVGEDGYLHLITVDGEERSYAFKEVKTIFDK